MGTTATMSLYRVSCPDGEDGWVVRWVENKVQAEICRIDLEGRLALRGARVEMHRFEVDASPSGIARFMTDHCGRCPPV